MNPCYAAYCLTYCRSQPVPGCGMYRGMSGHRGGCHPGYRCYTVVYIVDHNWYLAVVMSGHRGECHPGYRCYTVVYIVDHNRYLAVVCTEGCQDTEESVILGIDVIL